VSVARWRGQEGERQVTKFLKDVLERMSEPPWYSTIAQETNQTVSMKRNVNIACLLYIFLAHLLSYVKRKYMVYICTLIL